MGRVARNGRAGVQYSFVTYDDVYHFYNIRETHFDGEMERGTILQEILDENDTKEIVNLEGLRTVALNGYKKSLGYRTKVNIPQSLKEEILSMKIHSFFKDRRSGRDEVAEKVRKYRSNTIDTEKTPKGEEVESDNKYKDQFYIPYKSSRKTESLHSAAFSIHKDERPEKKGKRRNNEKIGELFKNWEKRKKTLVYKK